jgi:hypothetical protein
LPSTKTINFLSGRFDFLRYTTVFGILF